MVLAALFLGLDSGASNADSQPADAKTTKFVELTVDKKSFQGKIVAHNSQLIYLMERDGWLRRLKVAEIASFRKVSDQFTPYSAGELRDRLRHEFRSLEVVGTGHYLVAGPSKVVRGYAQTFEDQYRAVRSYFSVRGFTIPEPEFPMVAVVFPDFAAFSKNAAVDGVQSVPGLKGYYVPASNRISLFHETPVAQLLPASTNQPGEQPGQILLKQLAGFPPQLNLTAGDRSREITAWPSTDGDLESTMVHEATHQVAFNTGIHNRLGTTNPRWLVEGLATAFEAPGMRSQALQKTPGAKLNEGRLSQFREFAEQRRRPKTLQTFIGNGNLTDENLLDGYAQSWALTYFLLETRPREYAKYVKLIAARSPLEDCTEEQRVSDFRAAFGNDLVLFEAKFLRYIQDLK